MEFDFYSELYIERDPPADRGQLVERRQDEVEEQVLAGRGRLGDALPTLIGSLFPTSHSRAIDVRARSSTKSSFESGCAGSVASSTLASACVEINKCVGCSRRKILISTQAFATAIA